MGSAICWWDSIKQKRQDLKLSENQSCLVTFLRDNNILIALVSANCTDRLQLLDVSVSERVPQGSISQMVCWVSFINLIMSGCWPLPHHGKATGSHLVNWFIRLLAPTSLNTQEWLDCTSTWWMESRDETIELYWLLSGWYTAKTTQKTFGQLYESMHPFTTVFREAMSFTRPFKPVIALRKDVC